MNTVNVWLEGVSVIAPGLPDWQSAQAVLQASAPYQPAPSVLPTAELLPGAERRRASPLVKICLALGTRACEDAQCSPKDVSSIFCSSSADGQTTHAICDALSSAERMVSPTRFHNSVHNAASGYWGIAVGCMKPSQVICAYDATFSAGLLEAAAQVHTTESNVLLFAYDSEYPEPLFKFRPIPDIGGIGAVLSPVKTAQSKACLTLNIEPEADTENAASGKVGITPQQLPNGIADLTLENLPEQIPALAGLGILKLLAQNRAGQITLPYLEGLRITVQVQPC